MKLKVSKETGEVLIKSYKNFKYQYFRSSGPGGQHRNKVETAVRVIDPETGLFAESTDSKSQKQNKENAFEKLCLKLIDHYKPQALNRQINLGWAEKIRTYHEPRNIVTDHRTKISVPYDRVMNGDISKFIENKPQ